MGPIKSQPATSYWSSIETALNCLVSEKTGFLCTRFGDRRTERRTDRQTNRQTASSRKGAAFLSDMA